MISPGQLKSMLEIMQSTALDLETLRDDAGSLSRKIEMMDHQIKELREISARLDLLAEDKKIKWLTTTEVAQELKISPVKVRELFRTGKIRGYKLDPENPDSHIRFDRVEVYQDLKCI